MELKQLQYFRAVAKSQSISLAAEQLYISQPALSRCIRRLETEVGAELLTRKSSGVTLTEAGEAFLRELDTAALHFEQGLINARTIAARSRPGLSVVYSFEEFDNSLIYQLHQEFPEVEAHVDILPPEKAYRELLAGHADFAIIPLRDKRPGFRFECLLSEEMLLSPSKDHPLAGKRFVTLEELSGQSIVCNEVAFDRDSIERICSANGLRLNFLLSSNDHQTVGKFRDLTESMIFIPIGAVADHFGSGRNEELPARIVPQVFRRDTYVVYAENRILSPAEKYFLDLLHSHYRERHRIIHDFSERVFSG